MEITWYFEQTRNGCYYALCVFSLPILLGRWGSSPLPCTELVLKDRPSLVLLAEGQAEEEDDPFSRLWTQQPSNR